MTRRRRLWLMMEVVGVIIIALTVFEWGSDQSGWAHGVEFSPNLFCHRSFRYYQWLEMLPDP